MKKPDLNPKRIGEWIRTNAKLFWTVLTRRFGLKLISFLLAIILWNYVVSGDPSLTRTKVLNNVSGQVTGQTQLTALGLALSSDPSQVLDGFTVRLDVAQSQYGFVTNDNVRVSLDLSGVRTTGTQDVPLTAITPYGRVVDISPKTVTLNIDSLDSRSIPINVEFIGDVSDELWYNVSRTNPATITVSGASSVVRSITQARVYCDVSEQESGFTRAEQYVLLDGEGNEVNPGMLTRSSSSITVVVEVLPMREIAIASDIREITTGHVAEGYRVVGATIEPDVVMVAADRDLLYGISELKIEPVNIEGASQNVTAKAKISLLSDFRYSSAEEVYVTIEIEKEDEGKWVTVTGLDLSAIPDDYSAEYSLEGLRVWVSGKAELIEQCERTGVILSCNTIAEPKEGPNECKLFADEEQYAGLTIVPETDTIEITLTENAKENQ